MNCSDLTHIFLQLFVFAILCGSLSAQSADKRPPGCMPGRIVDCNLSQEDIVWATDANPQRCRIIKNRCIFNNMQCHRYNTDQPLMNETTKEECQKLCNNKCSSTPTGRVCAKRNNNLCFFQDMCTLEKHMCTEGESWGIELNRFCVEQTAANSVCPEVLA